MMRLKRDYDDDNGGGGRQSERPFGRSHLQIAAKAQTNAQLRSIVDQSRLSFLIIWPTIRMHRIPHSINTRSDVQACPLCLHYSGLTFSNRTYHGW